MVFLFENIRKMILIGKAELFRDLLDGMIGIDQCLSSRLQPQFLQIMMGRRTEFMMERTDQMSFGKSAFFSIFFEKEIFLHTILELAFQFARRGLITAVPSVADLEQLRQQLMEELEFMKIPFSVPQFIQRKKDFPA